MTGSAGSGADLPSCPVCCDTLGVHGGPCSLPCGHNGCLDCFKDVQQRNPMCPLCRASFARDQPLVCNHELKDLITLATCLFLDSQAEADGWEAFPTPQLTSEHYAAEVKQAVTMQQQQQQHQWLGGGYNNGVFTSHPALAPRPGVGSSGQAHSHSQQLHTRHSSSAAHWRDTSGAGTSSQYCPAAYPSVPAASLHLGGSSSYSHDYSHALDSTPSAPMLEGYHPVTASHGAAVTGYAYAAAEGNELSSGVVGGSGGGYGNGPGGVLALEPPTWLPDSYATACGSCHLPFRPLARLRHHCRLCGKVFCHACSTTRMLLPPRYAEREPQRVCGLCSGLLRPLQPYLAGTQAHASQPPVHDAPDAISLRAWLNNPFSGGLAEDLFKVANMLQTFSQAGRLHPERGLPTAVLAGARGLAILSVVKVGAGWSAAYGTGLLVSRGGADNSWSAPCAVACYGVGWGLQVGAELTDLLLVLPSDEALRSFCGNLQLGLGGNVGMAVGPVGRNAGASMMVGDGGMAKTYSYSCSKGGYVGVSLHGSLMTVRNSDNCKFYGGPVTARQLLLERSMPRPPAASLLYDGLHSLMHKFENRRTLVHTSGTVAANSSIQAAASSISAVAQGVRSASSALMSSASASLHASGSAIAQAMPGAASVGALAAQIGCSAAEGGSRLLLRSGGAAGGGAASGGASAPPAAALCTSGVSGSGYDFTPSGAAAGVGGGHLSSDAGSIRVLPRASIPSAMSPRASAAEPAVLLRVADELDSEEEMPFSLFD